MPRPRWRRLLAIFPAAALMLVAVTPVAAIGSCNPNRASNPDGNSTFAQVELQGSVYIDDLSARIFDWDPWVKPVAGSPTNNTRAYMTLREDSTHWIQWGVYKSYLGNFKMFMRAQIGSVGYSEEYSPTHVALEGGSLNGSGESHRFELNRSSVGFEFNWNVDGNNVGFLNTYPSHIFEPNYAKFVYEIENGGSQWWGDPPTLKMVTTRIHATDSDDESTVTGWQVTNDTNKAATDWVPTGVDAPYFYIHDKDC